MKHLVSVILSFTLLLAACNHGGIIHDRLMLADSLMAVCPDSALALLDTLDSHDESQAIQAWHTLLLAKANEKTFRRFHNDSLTSMAADYFRGRGDSLEIQALFYNGVIKGYNRDYAGALISLIETTEKAAAAGNMFYLAMAYREQADIYSSLFVESKHLEYADSARIYFDKAARPSHALREKLSLAEALISLNRSDSALAFLSSIRSDTCFTDAPAFNAAYHRLMADIYTKQRNYSLALTHIDSVAACTNGLTSAEFSQRSRLLSFIGDYRSAADALGEAHIYAFEQNDSAQLKLSEAILAARTDNYRKAYSSFLYFFNNYASSRHYLLTHPYTSIVSEYYRQQSENRNNELRSTRVRLSAWIVIAILISDLTVTVVIIYRHRLKEKGYRNDSLLSDIEHLRGLIDRHDSRFRESASDHYAIINTICEIAGCVPDSNDGYALLGKNVSRLISTFRTDEALSEIEKFVNNHFDGIMAKFRKAYPDFTDRNLKFVLLSFAGFSNQSITVILDIKSPNALRTMRHRIKKQIETSPSADSDMFLSYL